MAWLNELIKICCILYFKGAAAETFPNSNAVDVENTIKVWLKNAPGKIKKTASGAYDEGTPPPRTVVNAAPNSKKLQEKGHPQEKGQPPSSNHSDLDDYADCSEQSE